MTQLDRMNRILGWDAAWTAGGTGAWCLMEKSAGAWKVRWNRVCPTGEEVLEDLASIFKEEQPGLVAMDLPVARSVVRGYREADRATTRAFSRYGCPVHSPTPERPGEWGDRIQSVCKRYHYEVMTEVGRETPSVAEVYPHTVCLDMVRTGYRVPYKIQRASRLFPELSPALRREAISKTLNEILDAVERRGIPVPEDLRETPPLPLRHWKAREDRVDALLCAIAGIGIQEGRFLPFGSADAAIWNPDLKHLVPPRAIR